MLLPSYHDVTTLHSFAEHFFKRKLPIEQSFFFFSKNCLLLLSTQVFQVFDSSTCFLRHLEQTGQEGLDFSEISESWVGIGSLDWPKTGIRVDEWKRDDSDGGKKKRARGSFLPIEAESREIETSRH